MKSYSISPKELNLSQLRNGYQGMIPAIGELLCEASAFCFADQLHESGIELKVGGVNRSFYVCWDSKITDQTRSSFADRDEVTEYGAVGVAILLILEIENELTIVSRSAKGTGFDYWLGKKEQQLPFSMGAARLEISGIMARNKTNTIKRRLEIKQKQTKQSDASRLPAYIVIVEFSVPESHIAARYFDVEN